MKFDMSHEVVDIINGTKHSFDPNIIIPLKESLIEKACQLHKKIEPCGINHFCLNGNDLLFWYNNLRDNSTRIVTERICT